MNSEFQCIKCATEREIGEWLYPPLLPNTPTAFCIDADHEWCEAKRTENKCFRTTMDYRQICSMRGEGIDLQGVLF
jgi:hypothetical protein